MIIRKGLIIIIILIAVSSLQAQIDFKKFYYPAKDLLDKKVYCYHAKREEKEFFYYYLIETYVEKEDTIITINTYGSTFSPLEQYTVKMGEDAAELIKHITFETDKEKNKVEVESKIKGGELLPYTLKHDQTVKIEYGFDSKVKDYKKITQTKRVFKGRLSKKVKFNNSEHFVLKFIDYIDVSYKEPGRSKNKYFEQTYYYAEDIGMHSYESKLPNGKKTYVKLQKIITEAEWLELQNK